MDEIQARLLHALRECVEELMSISLGGERVSLRVKPN